MSLEGNWLENGTNLQSITLSPSSFDGKFVEGDDDIKFPCSESNG